MASTAQITTTGKDISKRVDRDSIFDSFDRRTSITPESRLTRQVPMQRSVSLPVSQPQNAIDMAAGAPMAPNANTPSSQREISRTLDHISPSPNLEGSNPDVYSMLVSQASSIEKMMKALETLQKDMSVIKTAIASSPSKAMPPPKFSKRKMDAPIELSDSSRESSRQRESTRPRSSKLARTHYASETKGSAVAAALQRLKGMDEVDSRSPSQRDSGSPNINTVPSSIAPKQGKTYDDHTEAFRSVAYSEGPASRTLLGDSYVPSTDRSSENIIPSNQISRETQEYLEKAVVDDPNDMDYMPPDPSAGASATSLPARFATPDTRSLEMTGLTSLQSTRRKSSSSEATESVPPEQYESFARDGVVTPHDPLSTPAKPIESLSQSSRHNTRGGKRPGAGRPRRNMALGDGRLTPEWEREDWDPDAYMARIKDPAFKSKPPPRKAIARRGVSRGGMAKFAAAENRRQTLPKRAVHRERDEEGFLLTPSGQRDGRSTRWRKLPEQQQKQQRQEPDEQVSTETRKDDGDTIELAKPGDILAQAISDSQTNTPKESGDGEAAAEVGGKENQDTHSRLMAKIFPKKFGGYSMAGL